MTDKVRERIENKFCDLLSRGFQPRIFAYSTNWAVEVVEEATDRFVLHAYDNYGDRELPISVRDWKIVNARVHLP